MTTQTESAAQTYNRILDLVASRLECEPEDVDRAVSLRSRGVPTKPNGFVAELLIAYDDAASEVFDSLLRAHKAKGARKS